MHVGAQTVGVMKAKSPRVCISSLCQWHELGVHGISTGCTDGIAVSAMTVHARPRPSTPAHAVMVPPAPHSGACCDAQHSSACCDGSPERLHSHSGACCDGSPPVSGPDCDSLTNLIWLRVKLSTQHRKFAQANSYRWLDQWHGFTLVIVCRRFWVQGQSVKLEQDSCHTGCEIMQPVINQNTSTSIRYIRREHAHNTECQLSASA
jgi:hypothetical protein